MWRQEFFLAFAMYFGHGAFWTYVFNAHHATAIPCRWKRVIERILVPIAAGPLLAMPFWASGFEQLSHYNAFEAYKYFCWAIGAYTLGAWTFRMLHSDAANGMRSNEMTPVNVRQPGEPPLLAKGWQALSHPKFNESERFLIERKSIDTPALPESWRGVTIAHLTDLHFTGRITKPFYDSIIEHTASLNADLILLTGDIIERTECEDWLPSTLGQLSAPLGVYFILGNHDVEMPNVAAVRARLEELGLVDVGSKVVEIDTPRGRLTLAGNERPWLGQAPSLPDPLDAAADELRIGLLHTPDTIRWAVRSRCQLAVAGHTHGGQIQIPLIGPMICPSLYGNRYARGLFRRGQTVMHVSRGIGAMHPIRYRCPPEVSLLTLG